MSHSYSRISRSFAIVALILTGALIMTAAPAGILAEQDEASGIDQFQPITITERTLIDLEALAEDLDPLTLILLYMEIQDFGEFETNLSEDMLREAASAQEVSDHLGAEFQLPGALPATIADAEPGFTISDDGFASYTFDVAKAHRISRLLELPTDWLPDPDEHERLTVSIDVSRSGMAKWQAGLNKLVTGQVGMPEIHIPEELDADALRDAVINDPRMPDELAEQLQAIDDWERTLPVPVPEGAEYRDVQIGGEDGFVLTMHDGSAVVWESGGTLFFVVGTFDGDQLERVANSLATASD